MVNNTFLTSEILISQHSFIKLILLTKKPFATVFYTRKRSCSRVSTFLTCFMQGKCYVFLIVDFLSLGGPADKSKRLKINDQILKIDNHDCFSLTKNEIKCLFNNCNSDKIVLTILANCKNDVE